MARVCGLLNVMAERVTTLCESVAAIAADLVAASAVGPLRANERESFELMKWTYGRFPITLRRSLNEYESPHSVLGSLSFRAHSV